ncbi:hypothetical protein [Amphibacillus indicireducens]|uniref:Bacterial EndoU nuclease domain-containing protein n=1 Tax=Amphibacillus indicireducens TaxID=1076330 RepID=A0ABP7W039_9BACI
MELEASATPVIFIVGKAAITVTIKYIAKKATANFVNSNIAVGSSKVVLSKAKMQHILQSHHPSFWTGAKGKSMFDPSLIVNNIKNIVNSVVRQNSSTISRNLAKGIGSDVRGTVNGVNYFVRIGKNGYVQSAYPVR